MGKVKSTVKTMAERYLRSKGYDVKFVWGESYDFVLPDGKKIVVKYAIPSRGKIILYFTQRQLKELTDDVEVMVMDTKHKEPILTLPFNKVKENIGKEIEINGRKVLIKAQDPKGTEVITIKCGPKTKREWKRLVAEFEDEEEALMYCIRRCKKIIEEDYPSIY